MIFKPFYYDETGCAAYLFGCGGKGLGALVDPQLHDVDRYLAFAASKGLRIAQVIDTHVHADHRSGGPAAAERAGAPYRLHGAATVAHPFEPLTDGESIELGNTVIQVLHTPGHTPESVCLLVTDRRRGPEPWFLLTGDTLFVGAVGRPDLPGNARDNAKTLYASLHDKVLGLDDALEIYPGHFAGSACGAGMSGKPSSTLGFEKKLNPLLSYELGAFVEAVSEVPDKPAGSEAIVRQNRGFSASTDR